jgi:hypothetical protein
MKPYFLSIALVSFACAGATPPANQTSAPAPVSEPAATTAPSSPAPSASVVGRYHLADAADEVNLELVSDGTFRMKVYGCDYGNQECGRWQEDAGVVKLVPKSGAPHVLWFAQSSWRAEVKELIVARTADGLHVEGSSSHAGAFAQEWKSGGTCANCGGEGPSGRHACNEPIPPCSQ